MLLIIINIQALSLLHISMDQRSIFGEWYGWKVMYQEMPKLPVSHPSLPLSSSLSLSLLSLLSLSLTPAPKAVADQSFT